MLIDWFSRGLGACAGGGELSCRFVSPLSGDARRLVVWFDLLSVVAHCCSVLSLLSIKDGLQ